jgi:hypothetical protein
MYDVRVCKNDSEGHDCAGQEECDDNREETINNATLILDETHCDPLKVVKHRGDSVFRCTKTISDEAFNPRNYRAQNHYHEQNHGDDQENLPDHTVFV